MSLPVQGVPQHREITSTPDSVDGNNKKENFVQTHTLFDLVFELQRISYLINRICVSSRDQNNLLVYEREIRDISSLTASVQNTRFNMEYRILFVNRYVKLLHPLASFDRIVPTRYNSKTRSNRAYVRMNFFYCFHVQNPPPKRFLDDAGHPVIKVLDIVSSISYTYVH